MYRDLDYTIRSDPAFRQGLEERMAALQRHQTSKAPAEVDAYHQVLADAIKYCNLNLAFLVPCFWPAYPRGKPLTFRDYPYAIQLFEFVPGGSTVVRGSRQIGKSTALCCRQQLNARIIPGYRSIYISPMRQQLTTYANRMREMENAMVGFTGKRNPDLRKNLLFKEFANGSSIELAYCLTSASPIRGKSTDEILLDEAQDFDPDLELEVLQTQAASPCPNTTYTGTSLTTDTLLEKKWLESSQALWVTRCTGCGQDNIPLPEHRVLDMIQRSGPACVKCGRPLNMRSGRFIHSFAERVRSSRLGFHIPQIITPGVYGNPLRWASLYELKLKQGGDRKFLQEVLGLAVEQGDRELTEKQLQQMCILGADLNSLRTKARNRGYEFVISGCDWGGTDYIPAQHIKVSTTVHVIMGVSGNGTMDLLHIRRYSGMDYDEIIESILRDHADYGGQLIASDFGVGAVYNSKIRERISPERHLVFGFVGPNAELLVSPKGPHMFNQYSLNKTESLSLVFEAVRERRIRCYDWDLAQEFLRDFLNIFRAPGERGTGSGASTFLYRGHPSKPNDTLMATTYAFILGKILLREPLTADASLQLWLDQTGCLQSGSFPGDLPHAFSG